MNVQQAVLRENRAYRVAFQKEAIIRWGPLVSSDDRLIWWRAISIKMLTLAAKSKFWLYVVQSSAPFLHLHHLDIQTMSVNDMLDGAAGKAHKNQGESLHTFLASLTTSGAIFGFGITAYILLRLKFPDY
ncbi:hypothetical protein V491_02596 [Pseudogymnoascus sp. VKM F-3775]|nr:hypothetical protein V491_02596 [Pseudogymnoascus sp. VKM F-3775]